MNKKKYLPSNKEDLEFIEELYKIKNINEIKEDIPILIEWLQDFNWEQADLICNYLLQFPLEMYKEDIYKILDSDDDMWKYWILLRLVKPIITKSDNWIIPKIEKLALNPTFGEKESEVDQIAKEIIDNFNLFNN
ncbi:DUF5071 domain-containing protein [uncultured Chryseobacterium sp.]|uniref:DUF5071 domain-containing protein n=1 Tax=uncultured Chryseobacterium sp. TaxID=259322 RepID=UPI0025FC78A6|nr:DUF5071 domain-containing protein [uncultured Chryseobacterium sp.]